MSDDETRKQKIEIDKEIRHAIQDEKARMKRDEENMKRMEQSSKLDLGRRPSVKESEDDDEAQGKRVLATFIPGSGVPTGGN